MDRFARVATSRPCATCPGVLPHRGSSRYAYPVIAGELATVKATNRLRRCIPFSPTSTARTQIHGPPLKGPIKLSTRSAPPYNCALNTPTRASNYSPEPPNCSVPPNQFSAAVNKLSPWPVHSRSVLALCSLVSALLHATDAPRPIQLS
jgi:hypothetical protein